MRLRSVAFVVMLLCCVVVAPGCADVPTNDVSQGQRQGLSTCADCDCPPPPPSCVPSGSSVRIPVPAATARPNDAQPPAAKFSGGGSWIFQNPTILTYPLHVEEGDHIVGLKLWGTKFSPPTTVIEARLTVRPSATAVPSELMIMTINSATSADGSFIMVSNPIDVTVVAGRSYTITVLDSSGSTADTAGDAEMVLVHHG